MNDYENIDSHYDKAGALFIIDLNNRYELMKLNLIPCTMITDSKRLKSLTHFINFQSRRDCLYPLII